MKFAYQSGFCTIIGVVSKPKIILFDLETLPNLTEALKVWPQLSNYPGLTLKATITTIICAGWKVYGKGRTECINAWDFPNWKKNVNDDEQVVKAIAKVLADADAVVTHNGKRFDWKFLQTRLMAHGLDPLYKMPHIDTKQLSSSNLFAFNNRLGTVGELLADDKKLDNGGWELWVDVWHRKPSAMRLMERYCKQDVKLLEKVFTRLRPFAGNIPNFNLWKVDPVCPSCGSKNLTDKGYRYTKITTYKRFQCKDCGSYGRTDTKGKNPRSL